ALSAANDQDTIRRARHLVDELNFRLAASTTSLRARLRYLQAGAQVASPATQARYAYHMGMTLAALHDDAAACEEFMHAQRLDSDNESLLLTTALAQARAGQTPEMTGLSAAEQQYVHAVRALHDDNATPDDLEALVARQPDETVRTLWRTLLNMKSTPNASPLVGLSEAASAVDADLAVPIIDYYVGVAALRRRDHEAATAAWERAQERGLATPAFADNQTYLLRQQIEELAAAEDWEAILTRLEKRADVLDNTALTEHLAYAHFHLGEVAAGAGRWRDAAGHWQRVDELLPSRYSAQNLALAEETQEHWDAAAQAWRNLLKRRPRKEKHPDYLDTEQVAILWKRAADCYARGDNWEEYYTCLGRAIEYAPDNAPWRMELVQAYLDDERYEAAENELQRALEHQPDFLPALLMLATLWDDEWGRDSIPIWRRALAVDPANPEAQDGLAKAIVASADETGVGPVRRLFSGGKRKTTADLLAQGLKELPGHPLLLAASGLEFARTRQLKPARAALSAAVTAALSDPLRYSGPLQVGLHELLHIDGEAQVERLLPDIRKVASLRVDFWLDQASSVLRCRLDAAWAERFWDEALALADSRRGKDSPVLTLARIMDTVASFSSQRGDAAFTDYARTTIRKFAARGAEIAPNSGIETYAEAVQTSLDRSSPDKTKRLLQKTKRQARKAGEQRLVDHVEELEMILRGPPPPAVLEQLLNMSPEALAQMLGDMDLDDDLFDDDDDDPWW
ncbi:MAG: tetratricopeptide repeat protein, partial [Caldilineaceae bacterium]|nr:tetratricopeptide repeat protein [Caldilineaceae bacterium]